jgi:hypothetical protein
MRQPPGNDHDAIMALWFAVIGTNGNGITSRVERLENRGRNVWLVLKDLTLIIIALGATVAAFLALGGH